MSDLPLSKGWFSRSYLPHLDVPPLQFVTFRFADVFAYVNCVRSTNENLVKAGLCVSPQDWPWGSALSAFAECDSAVPA